MKVESLHFTPYTPFRGLVAGIDVVRSGDRPESRPSAGPFRRDGLAVQAVGKRHLRPNVVLVQLVLEGVGARLELAPLRQQGRLVHRYVPLDDGLLGAEAPLQNLQVVVGRDLPEERQEGLDLLQLDDGADDAGVGLGDGRLHGNQLPGQALRLRRQVRRRQRARGILDFAVLLLDQFLHVVQASRDAVLFLECSGECGFHG